MCITYLILQTMIGTEDPCSGLQYPDVACGEKKKQETKQVDFVWQQGSGIPIVHKEKKAKRQSESWYLQITFVWGKMVAERTTQVATQTRLVTEGQGIPVKQS